MCWNIQEKDFLKYEIIFIVDQSDTQKEQLIPHICDGYHGNYNFLEVSPMSPRASWHVFFLYLINFANCTVWALKPRALRWDFNVLHMICSSSSDSSIGSLSLRNTSKGMGRVAVRQLDVEMRIEFYIVIF